MKTKMIDQSMLTSECWFIQMWGIEACSTCEFKDTDDCGGKLIRKKIEKGLYPSDGLPDQSPRKGE